MDNESSSTPLDPRVRRTRRLLQDALIVLVQEKSFGEISITDISSQAGVARVTFYQHFESKEALLLWLISDFLSKCMKVLIPLYSPNFWKRVTGKRGSMCKLGR
ncbi:MAG: TetR/AcrR family transcriptional regulator [Anaerolineae bacterium]|nr:TetR/AcrR family transcriptional regulator [Anaerolineae bacterium]